MSKTPTQWEQHHKSIKEDIKQLIEKLDLVDDEKREDARDELLGQVDVLLDRIMHAEGVRMEHNLPIDPNKPMPQWVPIGVNHGLTVLDMINLCMHNGVNSDAIFLIPSGGVVRVVQVSPAMVQLW